LTAIKENGEKIEIEIHRIEKAELKNPAEPKSLSGTDKK